LIRLDSEKEIQGFEFGFPSASFGFASAGFGIPSIRLGFPSQWIWKSFIALARRP
jgi:hypothetical protein